MAEDYYAVLGVTKDASQQEIKRAFRSIARECHPDVAGPDPAKEQRFKQAKEAYETLGDDIARARYDRRQERRSSRVGRGGSSSFREAFYRRSAGTPTNGPGAPGAPQQRTRRRVNDPANNLDLDDLFNDFGFGRPKASSRPRASDSPRSGPRSAPRGSAERARAPTPQPGGDVHLDLDVPEHIARDGGTVTAVYYRMQRSDTWRPGAPESGVLRIQDLADIRLLPGTSSGEVLHEKGKGDAGAYGGPYGDLVVRVHVVKSPGPSPSAKRSGARPRDKPEPPPAQPSQDQIVDITVAEAVLGGRVQVQTPQGPVRLTVPAGTSSGARMRLKGKGEASKSGKPGDHFVALRIVVPKKLDAESREIIERFAALNPLSR